MKILTVAAGTTVSTQLNYCPETIMFNSTPNKLVVRSLGEGVICDLDGTGIALMANSRFNRTGLTQKSIPLADGLIKGKNIEIEVTAGAAAINVYVFSNNEGENMIKHERATILAHTSQDFKKFLKMGIDFPVSDEQVTIVSSDGTTQLYTNPDEELSFICAQYDENRNVIDNYEQDISQVSIVAGDNPITTYKESVML